MTFGYGRIKVVAALNNSTTLVVIELNLLLETAGRSKIWWPLLLPHALTDYVGNTLFSAPDPRTP